ncbi:putative pentatricopeptide repeat-containing protein At5g59200, chloroplastic [Mangifera indica]|uniref:putative pentatricopeptide repeat-containing protein At5g59200, chloroplastic n=1 Tax=Mangifera indica TaxID=29780 RepID=UPI001CFB8F90|nr:putative pentatricopeptide repeat-containing protein At5g59200, chloroplastic [Mangifera indica]
MGYCSALAVFGHAVSPPKLNSEYKASSSSSYRRRTISLLKQCKHINQIQSIHAQIIRNAHEKNPFIIFELIRLSSIFNSIDYAFKIFQHTHDPNIYLYTAMIDGFVSAGSYIDGIYLYNRMINHSILPDKYVVTSVLKACGFELAFSEGRQVHGQVFKLGLGSNRSIMLKLIEFYGKCGEFKAVIQLSDEMPERDDAVALTVVMTCYVDHGLVEKAIDVFNRVKVKDMVCWTAMIDGLIRNGEMSRALDVFREMQREKVRPNEVTIVCVLSACSQLGALELGKWVHAYMGKYRIKLNQFVGAALINMYSRCGDIDKAALVFREIKERNVITYNSIIAGLAMHGRSIEAIDMFREMIGRGIRPSSITFVAVLNACGHGGLVDLGFEIFHSMRRDYEIKPQIEHYGCIVDLLGRAGFLEEAYNFIKSMKIAPDRIMLGALLSACKIHGNLELGKQIARTMLDCRYADSGTYILLSNAYASKGKWEEAVQMRAKMKAAGMKKEPGCSSIEVNSEIHEFFLGDTTHPQREKIYKKLEEIIQMLKLEGYSPSTEVVLHDIEDREKEWALAIHSEKLAICYGLISTKPFTALRVVKNLRVCNDCHTMIKFIAKITRRKIVVRDRNRFHHFENGACSCGDYW